MSQSDPHRDSSSRAQVPAAEILGATLSNLSALGHDILGRGIGRIKNMVAGAQESAACQVFGNLMNQTENGVHRNYECIDPCIPERSDKSATESTQKRFRT